MGVCISMCTQRMASRNPAPSLSSVFRFLTEPGGGRQPPSPYDQDICPSVLELQVSLDFHTGAGDPNSGPHASRESLPASLALASHFKEGPENILNGK